MKKKLLSALFYFSTVLYAENSFAQVSEFIKSHNLYKDYFRESLINTIKENEYCDFKTKDYKKVTLIIVPVYDFVCTEKGSSKSFFDLSCLQLDTSLTYAHIFLKNKLFATAWKKWQFGSVQNSIYPIIDSNDLVNLRNTHKEVNLLDSIQKISDTYFFIKFNNYDNPFYIRGIGFLDKENEVKLLDISSSIITVSEFLCKKYGTVEKALENFRYYERRDTALSQLLGTNKDSATIMLNVSNFLKNNFSTIREYFPEDTVRVMNSFLTELNHFAGLRDCQLALYKSKIANIRFNPAPYKITDYDFNLYGYDMSSLVESLLTAEQLKIYTEKKRINGFLETRAFDIFYYNVIKSSMSSEDMKQKFRELLKE